MLSVEFLHSVGHALLLSTTTSCSGRCLSGWLENHNSRISKSLHGTIAAVSINLCGWPANTKYINDTNDKNTQTFVFKAINCCQLMSYFFERHSPTSRDLQLIFPNYFVTFSGSSGEKEEGSEHSKKFKEGGNVIHQNIGRVGAGWRDGIYVLCDRGNSEETRNLMI